MISRATLRAVTARDRSISLTLVVTAVISWVVVAAILTLLSPVGDAGVQLLGALAIGVAVGLTAWPLLWSAGKHSDPHASLRALSVAGRRSTLVGLVVAILVVLRALDMVGVPVMAFLVITAGLVEAAFTLRG